MAESKFSWYPNDPEDITPWEKAKGQTDSTDTKVLWETTMEGGLDLESFNQNFKGIFKKHVDTKMDLD